MYVCVCMYVCLLDVFTQQRVMLMILLLLFKFLLMTYMHHHGHFFTTFSSFLHRAALYFTARLLKRFLLLQGRDDSS